MNIKNETQFVDRWTELTSADVMRLAEEHGTPFYIYDATAIEQRVKLVRDSLQGLAKVYYAVKANPNLELLRAVNSFADGLDISSGGELEQAYLAGFDMENLSFAGPAKTADELRLSIARGVGCISVESMRELQNIIELAKSLGTKANILIRVNPKFLNRAFGMKMGGKPIQFGIDEENLDGILPYVTANLQYLNFNGIHIYAGSQCFDVEGVVEGVTQVFRIVREIEANTGLFCRKINLGGGFGVSHGLAYRELEIGALAEALVAVLREMHGSSSSKREIFFELGRFLTANAGLYVVKVISGKESRGKHFYMVDGGLHHHLSASGTFGSSLRANFPIGNLTKPGAPKLVCSLAGPSCNPTDLLGIDVELPSPGIGDLLGVYKSGSYGFTASPLLFLGRKTPVELVWRDDKIIVGRPAFVMQDFN